VARASRPRLHPSWHGLPSRGRGTPRRSTCTHVEVRSASTTIQRANRYGPPTGASAGTSDPGGVPPGRVHTRLMGWEAHAT
jgi:hypothetical protein